MELAQRHGFPLAGVLNLDQARGAISNDIARYDTWLGAGMHGEMAYLQRGRDRRTDPALVFDGAKGMLCVATPYGPRDGDEIASPATQADYAKYLRGRDYHVAMKERLEALLSEAATRFDFSWKVCCDTSAVLERSWAALAGLGWIGKNTCLIHPRLGSYLFLAEALLSENPGGAPRPMRDHCGKCDRCLKACPTDAFPEPGALDARRCISYWTLEKRGPLTLGDDDGAALGNRVAGCDICQEVCPFNRKPRPPIWDEWRDAAADATALRDWETLLNESEEDYRERVRRSALSWVKPHQFRRNLALSLASVAGELGQEVVQRLLGLVIRREDAESDPDALAAWTYCRARMEQALRSRVPHS
ncbi:MAG: tRNA epoxyqueuosine(34) reductase QueG [Deltaproteobacteria bacterium]|nr:tRNA epoxyqueuosine(34) reductase QueG [Deltaproteobacteria bacterium]